MTWVEWAGIGYLALGLGLAVFLLEWITGNIPDGLREVEDGSDRLVRDAMQAAMNHPRGRLAVAFAVMVTALVWPVAVGAAVKGWWDARYCDGNDPNCKTCREEQHD